MRFFSTTVLAVSALVGFAVAVPQTSGTGASTSAPAPSPTGTLPNPISHPTAGTQCAAGKPCTIEWSPDSSDTVTLRLRRGDSDNLDTVETIAEDIPNSGSYSWIPDEDLEGDDTYAIEIINDAGVSNYSPQFQLDSDGEGKSTTSSVTSTKTTSVSSTSTTPTTVSNRTTTETSSTTTPSTTTTSNGTSTASTTVSRTPRPTSDDDDDAPNPNSGAEGLLAVRSPLALILCVVAALAYLG